MSVTRTHELRQQPVKCRVLTTTTPRPLAYHVTAQHALQLLQGGRGKAGAGWGSVLVQAGDEVFELVSEAGADSLAGAGDLGCNGQAGHLLHQPLPTAPHHLH